VTLEDQIRFLQRELLEQLRGYQLDKEWRLKQDNERLRGLWDVKRNMRDKIVDDIRKRNDVFQFLESRD
jgi:hypothetical protein